MGRELKRVPLGFQWPLEKTWSGYLNPHYSHCKNCPDCDGAGTTTGRKRLEELVGLLMLSGSDAATQRCHPYFNNMDGLHYSQSIAPSKDLAELTARLAGRKASVPFGHDAIDRWSATKAILRAAKLRDSWGICKSCKGDGSVWDSPENKRKASRWKSKEPPKGEGYQIWETVSEGSPISPVFERPEELADWMAAPGNGWSSDAGTTREQWLKFILGPGWAPSFISTPATGLISGVAAP